MANPQYERGRRFEYRCKAALEAAGWHVWRTPGSKSPADLIALREGHAPVLVQCKIGDSLFGTAELRVLRRLADACGAVAVSASKGLRRGSIIWRFVENSGLAYARVWPDDSLAERVKGAGDDGQTE